MLFFCSFVANLTLLIDNELGIQEKLQWNTYMRRDEAMQINGVVGIALCLKQQPLF